MVNVLLTTRPLFKSLLVLVSIEPMGQTFGEMLAEMLQTKKITMRQYAKLAGYPKGHSFISRVVHGKLAPPMTELDRWAKPLGLSKIERAQFDFLAALANSPPLIQSWFSEHPDVLIYLRR